MRYSANLITMSITGCIRTARFDEKRMHNPVEHFLRTFSVSGPQNHSVMVSLQAWFYLECEVHSVTIYVEDGGSRKRLARKVCKWYPGVDVYSAHVFHVHWAMLTKIESGEYRKRNSRGFHLRFSFHEVGVSPLTTTASLAKRLWRPPREQQIRGSIPACAVGIFPGLVIPVT